MKIFPAAINRSVKNHVPKHGDFIVDNKFTLEAGGKGKSKKQIAGTKNSCVVKDDLAFSVGNNLLLWMFGILF